MVAVADATVATVVTIVVTASLPFYLYGAWIILTSGVVTWNILIRHLRVVGVGLTLTTIPMVFWMVPRLFTRLDSFAALHAVIGLQAYALLVFALTGVFRIFQVKRAHNAYHDDDQNTDISDLHENIDAWRLRIRIGILGYVVLWILAWIVGLVRFVLLYL